MSGKSVNRMLVGVAISAAATLGMTPLLRAQAPDEKDKERQERHQKDQKDQKDQKGERGERSERKQAAPQERAKPNEDQHKAQQEHQAEQQKAQQQRQADQQKQQNERVQKQDQDRPAQRQEQDRSAQKQERKQDEPRRTTSSTERKGQDRQEHQVTDQRRKQLDAQQQQRLAVQKKQETTQTHVWTQRESTLQKQNRTAQYRFEQQYQERRRQQIQQWNARSYDYRNDSRFYAAANYRYSYGGNFYQTNQYGADLLRQAVNSGYQQGFPAGRADREDGWRSGGYRNSYAYLDGDYGYNGYYVNRGEYQHYFREGFRRGYEDGFNSRSQYGSGSDDNMTILAAVLSQILNLVSN